MEQKNIGQFIQTARARGIPDTQIFQFLQQQGVISQTGEILTPSGDYVRPKGVEPIQPIEPTQIGFLGGIGEDIQRRGETFAKSMERQRLGEQTSLETGLQLAGQTAGGVFDILGRGLGAAAKGIGKVADIATAPGRAIAGLFGKEMEKPTEALTRLGQAFLETPLAKTGLQALGQGIESYQAWKSENERAAANLESALNIALLSPVGTGVKAGATVTGKEAGVVGRALTARAESGLATQRLNIAKDLVTPEIKGKILPEGQTLRSIREGGITTPRAFAMESPIEKRIVQTVSEIPGIEKGNVLAKGQKLEDFISTEARGLVELTKTNDVIFPKQELVASLNRTAGELRKTPLLSGDAGKSADRVIAEYVRRIGAAEGKLSEVLRVRKEMDAWIKKFAGEKTLSGERANAMSLAVRELRNTTNDYLITKSPVGSEIRASLQKQSDVFRALDVVTPKALTEAKTAVDRAVEILQRKLGTRSKIVQGLALVTGTGALAAMGVFAPVATAFFGASGLAGLYKLAVSPAVQKRIGSLLQGIEKTLVTATAQERPVIQDLVNTLSGLGIIAAREATEEIQKLEETE